MDSDGRVKFYIQAYIPAVVEDQEKEYYDNMIEAVSDANNMEAMQPENIYEVIKITTDFEGGEVEEVVSTVSLNVGR